MKKILRLLLVIFLFPCCVFSSKALQDFSRENLIEQLKLNKREGLKNAYQKSARLGYDKTVNEFIQDLLFNADQFSDEAKIAASIPEFQADALVYFSGMYMNGLTKKSEKQARLLIKKIIENKKELQGQLLISLGNFRNEEDIMYLYKYASSNMEVDYYPGIIGLRKMCLDQARALLSKIYENSLRNVHKRNYIKDTEEFEKFCK